MKLTRIFFSATSLKRKYPIITQEKKIARMNFFAAYLQHRFQLVLTGTSWKSLSLLHQPTMAIQANNTTAPPSRRDLMIEKCLETELVCCIKSGGSGLGPSILCSKKKDRKRG